MITQQKKAKKLQLKRETLATLDLGRLAAVRGGVDDGAAANAPARETISNNYTECSIYCPFR